MKILLTTAALLGIGTAVSFASTITFDSAITGDGTYASYVQDFSIADLLGDANSDSTLRAKTYLDQGIIFSVSSTTATVSKSLTLGSMYTTDDITDITEVYLSSVSIITGSGGSSYLTQGVVLSISDGTNTYYSDVVSYDADASTEFGFATFNFSEEVVLDLTQSYTFTTGTLMGDTFTSASLYYAGVNPYYSNYNGFDIDGAHGAQPVFQIITTATVPEPSMFGLLAGLGAIGLVVARRRRHNRKA
ncbi:MAG: PEP-CTERM sorting domain-containing protein [Opitutae bacterium]|nr:PEP-CTERM sorting domain-containing protein [Opitutae bacterium]